MGDIKPDLFLTWFQITTGEWIPNVTLITDTNRNMVSDSAVCINTTKTRTRVLTFPVDAGLVSRTICIDLALRSAVGR